MSTGAESLAFGSPRESLGNRFVYAVISARARGLSVGVNLNPDKQCDYACTYCEVDRADSPRDAALDIPVMIGELETTLRAAAAGTLRTAPHFKRVPAELMKLRHVALSGDGEPTLCPNFEEAIEGIVHLRARGSVPFFKLVLITNGSGLDRPEVGRGLGLFTRHDEIWAKLDGGTQAYLDRVNRPGRSLEQIVANILLVARQRPVVIQSLFPAINGEAPAASEIEAYVQRLEELKQAGARIPLVQVYSATRPSAQSECGHLPLRTLTDIARRVQQVTGLRAEVF
jgi:wyosine [tRNA(Phe)-imidazoG37] synthetase (radical SAM superfamily)